MMASLSYGSRHDLHPRRQNSSLLMCVCVCVCLCFVVSIILTSIIIIIIIIIKRYNWPANKASLNQAIQGDQLHDNTWKYIDSSVTSQAGCCLWVGVFFTRAVAANRLSTSTPRKRREERPQPVPTGKTPASSEVCSLLKAFPTGWIHLVSQHWKLTFLMQLWTVVLWQEGLKSSEHCTQCPNRTRVHCIWSVPNDRS